MNPQMVMLLNVSETGRVFGLDQQMLISIGIQLLNVAILVFAMSRLLYNPVRNFMKKRADGIKEQIDRAENDISEARDMKLQYEQRISDIELERNEILDSARKAASEKSKSLLAEAKEEADAIKARASVDIQIEQERVKDEMKKSIIEVSSAMASKFVAAAIDQKTHDRLFEETMTELASVSWQGGETAEDKTWQS